MKEVVPYNAKWVTDFEEARVELSSVFCNVARKIHHIGSTSIPGMDAKPIIDILVEVSDIEHVDSMNTGMEGIGFECMGEYGIPARRYFRRIDDQGVRTHHVHVFEAETGNVFRHLAFRDYLIAHPDKAREYSGIKRGLAVSAGDDWEFYVKGKDSFVRETEELAVAWAL